MSRARRCAMGELPFPTRASVVTAYSDAEIRWVRVLTTVRPNEGLISASGSR